MASGKVPLFDWLIIWHNVDNKVSQERALSHCNTSQVCRSLRLSSGQASYLVGETKLPTHFWPITKLIPMISSILCVGSAKSNRSYKYVFSQTSYVIRDSVENKAWNANLGENSHSRTCSDNGFKQFANFFCVFFFIRLELIKSTMEMALHSWTGTLERVFR
jgi:hypothetical protein